MSTRNLFLPGLLALSIASCDDSPVGPDGEKYLEIREVTVGPTLARCYGVGERTCLVVDGFLFYDSIEGFDYEAGYDYLVLRGCAGRGFSGEHNLPVSSDSCRTLTGFSENELPHYES